MNNSVFVGGPPMNNSVFVGGPPMNNSLFVGGPPMNNSVLVGGPPTNNIFSAFSCFYSCFNKVLFYFERISKFLHTKFRSVFPTPLCYYEA